LQDANDKIHRVTIFPFNSSGYKFALETLFSIPCIFNRIFNFEIIVSLTNNNCYVVFEVNNLRTINNFFFGLIDNINMKMLFLKIFFFGIKCFVFFSTNFINKKMLEKVLPFFPIKCLKKEEKNVLKILKLTNLTNNFVKEDSFFEFFRY